MPVDWSEIFFLLARYCGFTKDDVWQLTLPQLERYLIHCHRNIAFQFKANAGSIAGEVARIFGGGGKDHGHDSEEGRYGEATEEDITMLARFLGGGM